MKQHIAILRAICDSQSHSPDCSDAREAIGTLRDVTGEEDFTFDFDGNEYRLISGLYGITCVIHDLGVSSKNGLTCGKGIKHE